MSTPITDAVSAAPAPAGAPRLPHLQFGFTGGAAGWLGVGIGGFLITLITLGICYPWAVVMTYRWKTKHTWLNGQGAFGRCSAC